VVSQPVSFNEGDFSMATTTKAKPKEAKNRPVHEIRFGRIRAAIWQNETEVGTRHNVTISRLYKDGDDWKDSTSFGRDDLPRSVTRPTLVSSSTARRNPTGTATARTATKAAKFTSNRRDSGNSATIVKKGFGERHHPPLSACAD
jgi:hypothetical protein